MIPVSCGYVHVPDVLLLIDIHVHVWLQIGTIVCRWGSLYVLLCSVLLTLCSSSRWPCPVNHTDQAYIVTCNNLTSPPQMVSGFDCTQYCIEWVYMYLCEMRLPCVWWVLGAVIVRRGYAHLRLSHTLSSSIGWGVPVTATQTCMSPVHHLSPHPRTGVPADTLSSALGSH